MSNDHDHDVTDGVRHQALHDDDALAVVNGFATLGLRDELLAALDDLGYEEPTPIQRETIPLLLTGRDLLGQAATGTGKTAAFALPALQMIDASRRVPQVLVLVPTRELAVQVSEAMFRYGRELGVKVVPVFGGQPIQRQLQALDRGVHVVVATPGRALDHIGRGSLALDAIQTVILDEADEMLDMGFTDDIESILESTPDDRQTVLFSATMPSRITSIAKRYQRSPERITIGRPDSEPGAKVLVRQTVYVVQRAHKPSALGRILDIEAPKSALVFCRTRTEVDQLTETMNARGYRAEALHGGMDQAQRDRVMSRLRDGTAELLVATDVAARGLDVDTLTHVVNYDVPSAAESYVHRIGRVGRAGREGVAITLAEPRERRPHRAWCPGAEPLGHVCVGQHVARRYRGDQVEHTFGERRRQHPHSVPRDATHSRPHSRFGRLPSPRYPRQSIAWVRPAHVERSRSAIHGSRKRPHAGSRLVRPPHGNERRL